MVDTIVTWACHYPLQAVGGLAVVSILIGVLLTPRLYEVTRDGQHPRC